MSTQPIFFAEFIKGEKLMFWHKNIVFKKKKKNNKIILLLNKILDVFL